MTKVEKLQQELKTLTDPIAIKFQKRRIALAKKIAKKNK